MYFVISSYRDCNISTSLLLLVPKKKKNTYVAFVEHPVYCILIWNIKTKSFYDFDVSVLSNLNLTCHGRKYTYRKLQAYFATLVPGWILYDFLAVSFLAQKRNGNIHTPTILLASLG